MNLKDGILNGLASTNSIPLNGSVELNTTQSQPNVSALVAPMSAKETRLSFRLTLGLREQANPPLPVFIWRRRQ